LRYFGNVIRVGRSFRKIERRLQSLRKCSVLFLVSRLISSDIGYLMLFEIRGFSISQIYYGYSDIVLDKLLGLLDCNNFYV